MTEENILSAGFDIAVVVSEASINKIYQISYQLGLLPTHASTSITDATGKHALELYFLLPTLEFVVLEGVENPVKLRFPFLAQVPSKNVQGAGAVSLFLTAMKQDATDKEGETVTWVALDFSNVPTTQLQFEPELHPPLPPAAGYTFGPLDQAVIEGVAAPLAASILSSGISQIPLTPRISSAFGFFTFRTHVDSGFSLPPEPMSHALPRVLGVYVNFDESIRQAPAKAPVELRTHVIPHPHHASYVEMGADEMKAALPVELLDERLKEARAARGLDELPAPLPGDHSVIINALEIKFGAGRLIMTGNATKLVSPGLAPDVDFTVELGLAIVDGAIHAIVLGKDVELPWWTDALQVLVPLISSAVFAAIERMVLGELDPVGDLSGELLSDINGFSNELPGIELAKSALQVRNEGQIEISPSGLVLPGQIHVTLGQLKLPQPVYVYGHRHSHEFHRLGCAYQQKMKWENTILFLSPSAALNHGYNGCRACYPNYDADSSGRLLLRFRDLNPSSTNSKSVVGLLYFKLLQSVIVDEVVEFEVQRSYTGKLAGDGVAYFHDFHSPELLPGLWQLQVNVGGWSTTCQLAVEKWGNDINVAFTVGVDGCEIAFGHMPPYPEPH